MKRVAFAFSVLVALISVGGGPAKTGELPPLPLRFDAIVEPFDAKVEEFSYKRFDAKGRPMPDVTWRVVSGTGNPIENYLASTARGTLLDFGGEWLRFSKDEGRTWSSVLPPEELREGWFSFEGAVATAPGGDVVAIGQDSPNNGAFRAMTFKYEAKEDAWFYSFAESSSPVMDRPAIGVLPGPFQIAGQSVPYVTAARAGVFATKSYWTYSLDGLNYVLPNSRFMDAASNTSSSGSLPIEPWRELDWIQSHDLVGIAPLGEGSALAERPSIGAFDTEAHTPRTVLDPSTLRWRSHDFGDEGPPTTGASHCVDGANSPPCLTSEGRTLADSRGWLHHVSYGEEGITYWFSSDGGKTWGQTVTQLLDGYSVPNNANLMKSFKVSGAHNKTAVAVHAFTDRKAMKTQDLVYIFRIKRGRPQVHEIYVLGEPGHGCLPGGIAGVGGGGDACDFPSITFVRGGRIAVSFTDLLHKDSTVAVQLAPVRDRRSQL